MARIPQYTRTVLLDRSNAGNISAAAAAAGGNEVQKHLAEVARADKHFRQIGSIADEYKRQRDAEGKVKAQERFNEFERSRIKILQEQRNEAQANPSGFTNKFDEWHKQQLGEIETKLGESDGRDAFDRDYFRQLMDRDRTSVLEANSNWENGMRVQNTFVGSEQAIDDMNVNFVMSNPTYKDFVDYTKKIRDYANQVGSNIFSPQDTVKVTEYGIDNAANAFFDQKLQEDPLSVKYVLEYGQGGKDNLIRFMIDEIEKGYKPHKDNDGGLTRYGINTKHHPSYDINSGREGAEAYYAKNIWDKRLDDMAPAFQAVAFDAIVNHGNDDDTWAMIKAANGNPYALISLRQKKYEGLVATGRPEYVGQGPGWNNRMQKLTSFVQTLEGGGSEFLRSATLVDAQVIANVKKRIPQAIESKKAQEEKAAIEANQADEITKINNQNALLETIEKEDVTYDEKMLQINRQEVTGQINQEFASDARRYLESKKAINATTNADLMAEVVTQMYDLNTVEDMNEKDYLRGVQNIKRKIMALRADGTLSRDDEDKLNGQMRTLMAAKTADATSTLSYSIGEARKMIDQSVPPELRGQTVRQLFYKVDEELSKGGSVDTQTERNLYKQHAREIIDTINKDRRQKAMNTIDNLQTIQPERDASDAAFLQERGYTMDDVKETAKKHNMTERQVIEHLKAQKK